MTEYRPQCPGSRIRPPWQQSTRIPTHTLNLSFHLKTMNPIPVGFVSTAVNVQLASAELLAHHPYHRRLDDVDDTFLTTTNKALRNECAVASKRVKTVADKPSLVKGSLASWIRGRIRL